MLIGVKTAHASLQGDDSDSDSEYSEDGADTLTVDDATGADRSCTGDDIEKNGEGALQRRVLHDSFPHNTTDVDTPSTNSTSFTQSQDSQRTGKLFYQQRFPFKVQKLPYANELEVRREAVSTCTFSHALRRRTLLNTSLKSKRALPTRFSCARFAVRYYIGAMS